MGRLQAILIAALLVVSAAIGYGVVQRLGESGGGSGVTIGAPAPDYSAQTLGGETIRLSDFQNGKAVMVNIWATWCGPCREEMPDLQTLYENYKDDGLVILGVSIDDSGQEQAIRRYVEHAGVTFPILHDPGQRIVLTFQTVGTPQTFLIGKNGELIQHWNGQFDPQSDGARAIVEKALGLTS